MVKDEKGKGRSTTMQMAVKKGVTRERRRAAERSGSRGREATKVGVSIRGDINQRLGSGIHFTKEQEAKTPRRSSERYEIMASAGIQKGGAARHTTRRTCRPERTDLKSMRNKKTKKKKEERRCPPAGNNPWRYRG